MRAAARGMDQRTAVAVLPPRPQMLYQPILALASGEVAGYEALARFPDTGMGPLETFVAAWAAGEGPPLETSHAEICQAAVS